VGQALGGIVQVVGQLAVPLMKMATVVLQALAPMQGVLLAFADAFGVVIDRVTADGSMQAAIGAFVDLFAALLLAIPPLIPPMVQLAVLVLPLLTKGVELLTGWLTQLLGWMAGHSGVIITLATALLVLAGAMKIVTITTAIMSGALALNPIGAVAIAVAALAAGLIIAYRQSDTFRQSMREVFDWLRQHALPAITALREGLVGGLVAAFRIVQRVVSENREELTTLWHAFVAIAGFILDEVVPIFAVVLKGAFILLGVQVAIFVAVWSGIVIAFQAVADAARWVWDAFQRIGRGAAVAALAVRVGFDRVVGFARSLPGRIRAAVVGLMSGITDRTAAAVTWVAARLGGIVSFVRGLPGRIANAAVGLMSGVKEEIGRAVRWITDRIQMVVDFIQSIPGRLAGVLASVARSTAKYAPGGGLLDLFGHAAGGITGAAAGGSRSGWSMVGEQGRELVRLPYGSSVHSNPDTERMLGAGAGGAQVVLQVAPGGSALDRMFVEWLREAVRKGGGGSVQAYLGS
jgi:phage-related protein